MKFKQITNLFSIENQYKKKREVRKLLMVIFFVLIASPCVMAQRFIQFSQYMNNELRINPAFAGQYQTLSLAFAARVEGVNHPSTPRVFTFTAHTLLKKRIGIGVTIANTKKDFYNNFGGTGQFSYKINFPNKSTLSFGISAGIDTQSFGINFASEVKDDGDGVVDSLNNGMKVGFTLGAGIYYEAKNLEIGFSSPTLLKPDFTSGEIIAQSLLYFTRYKYEINYNWRLYPSLFLQHAIYENQILYDLNLATSYNNVLFIGVGYKSTTFLNLMFRMRLMPNLIVGYTFDLPTINTNNLQLSAHEIMINYLLFNKSKISPWRGIYQ